MVPLVKFVDCDVSVLKEVSEGKHALLGIGWGLCLQACCAIAYPSLALCAALLVSCCSIAGYYACKELQHD